MDRNVKKIVVHSGAFHCDDVAVAALLLTAFPGAEVIRTFKPEAYTGDDTVIADIGFGRYDHHQQDCKLRADGRKRAACGLIFEDFWQEIGFSQKSAEIFERSYIIPIEDQDNGAKDENGNLIRNPLSEAVKAFNPSWNSSESSDEAFMRAVDFLKLVIENELRRTRASEEAETVLADAVKNQENGIVVLDKFIPCGYLKNNKDIRYIVFPSQRGGWEVQANDRAVGLPKAWLTNKPSGCDFVHPNGFVARFNRVEDIKAALS